MQYLLPVTIRVWTLIEWSVDISKMMICFTLIIFSFSIFILFYFFFIDLLVKQPLFNDRKFFQPTQSNPGRREKNNLNFYFRTSLWCLKRFYEGLCYISKNLMTQPVFTCSKLTPGAPDQCKICSKLIRMTTITSFWCLYCYLWTDFSQMKWGNSSVIRQKGASQNGCYKKTKQAKFPENPAFLSPAGVKKCLFFGKFDVLCFLVTPVLSYALLPYCGRIDHTYIESFVVAGSQDIYSTLAHFSTLFTKWWQVWQILREYLLVHFDGCRICD